MKQLTRTMFYVFPTCINYTSMINILDVFSLIINHSVLTNIFDHIFISPLSSRKSRGEGKKCRKVYGMENRDMWCTACRWKKACQRFTD